MQPVQAKVEGCALVINWAAPYDSGSPITEYDIQLQVRPGILISLTGAFCDKDAAATACTVPMEGLLKEPFGMKAGDPVILRAIAVNEAGRSKPSDALPSDTKIVAVPEAPGAPVLDKETADSLLVKWQASAGSEITYEVYADTVSQGTLTRLGEVQDTEYALEKVGQRRFYKVEVRARNACGSSPASAPLAIELQFAPARMAAPTVKAEGCAIRIAWTRPDERGDPIRGYAVAIRADGDAYYYETQCKQATKTSCLVSAERIMENLQVEPGDEVRVYVKAANVKGWGRDSPLSAEVKIPAKPAVMEAPELESTTGTTIQISWEKVPDATGYEVRWSQGTSGPF